MYQVIIVIHVLLGLGIIGLILMQQGKGADAGATFGGGASGSVFGAQGAASFLSRTTAILATLFFITSLGLAWLNGNKTGAAADFMAEPESQKQTSELNLPNGDGAILPDKPAIPAPETQAITPAPVAEQSQTPSPGAETTTNTGLEKIEVPKEDEVKVVEEHQTKPKEEKPEVKPEPTQKSPHKKK